MIPEVRRRVKENLQENFSGPVGPRSTASDYWRRGPRGPAKMAPPPAAANTQWQRPPPPPVPSPTQPDVVQLFNSRAKRRTRPAQKSGKLWPARTTVRCRTGLDGKAGLPIFTVDVTAEEIFVPA